MREPKPKQTMKIHLHDLPATAMQVFSLFKAKELACPS